jgi:hypothetical protein
MIRGGRIVAEGTVTELIDEHGGPRLEDAYLRVMRGAVTEVPG